MLGTSNGTHHRSEMLESYRILDLRRRAVWRKPYDGEVIDCWIAVEQGQVPSGYFCGFESY